MKAVRIHEFGGPEVLTYEDVPDPKPRKDQVLIRVRACSLNHLDLWVRKGLPGVNLPHILGSDIAGDIVEVGEYVTDLKPGQRVLVAPMHFCNHCVKCVAGLQNQCRQFTVLGNAVDGGNCELFSAPAVNVIPIPNALDFNETAGALVTCGATTGPKIELDLRFLFSRQLSVLGSYMGTMSELHEVLGHVFAGRLKPIIDHTFPLKEIRTAHEYMEKSQMFGKIVLNP